MFLLMLGICGFASSIAGRLVDPMITSIARDFAVDATSVAMLASAYTLPYAFAQPLLGPVGDSIGKARVLTICLWILAVCLAAGALAPTLPTLYATRIVAGAAAGGVVPLALAMIGDRYAVAARQVAMTRFLSATLIAQLVGSTVAGALAETIGWRAAHWGCMTIAVAAAAAAVWKLRAVGPTAPTRFRMVDAIARYRLVFQNPRARICYTMVIAEGIAIYGVLPFVGGLLEARGLGGPKEAGFVIAGIGIGGMVFVAIVGFMLRRLGTLGLMPFGGTCAALGLAGLILEPSWPVQTGLFGLVGFGFFMLHNSIQNAASELAPSARGSAMALHAFFFFAGQAAGPPLFGIGLPSLGVGPTLSMAAIIVAATGLIGAALLKRS